MLLEPTNLQISCKEIKIDIEDYSVFCYLCYLSIMLPGNTILLILQGIPTHFITKSVIVQSSHDKNAKLWGDKLWLSLVNHQLSMEKTDLTAKDTNVDSCPCNISLGISILMLSRYTTLEYKWMRLTAALITEIHVKVKSYEESYIIY